MYIVIMKYEMINGIYVSIDNVLAYGNAETVKAAFSNNENNYMRLIDTGKDITVEHIKIDKDKKVALNIPNEDIYVNYEFINEVLNIEGRTKISFRIGKIPPRKDMEEVSNALVLMGNINYYVIAPLDASVAYSDNWVFVDAEILEDFII